MTNLEVFKGSISGNYTDEQLRAYLVKQGLNPDDVFDKKNEEQIDLATIETIIFLMGTSQSVRELDYQVTRATNADLQALLNYYYNKWGITNPTLNNKITSRNLW